MEYRRHKAISPDALIVYGRLAKDLTRDHEAGGAGNAPVQG
jgi:hypothetical protein